MNIHIHTIETGNQCRDHQKQGNSGHTLHDYVQIVGNNRSKGIHRTAQDITIDSGGVLSLPQFDLHIFYQIGIEKFPLAF